MDLTILHKEKIILFHILVSKEQLPMLCYSGLNRHNNVDILYNKPLTFVQKDINVVECLIIEQSSL